MIKVVEIPKDEFSAKRVLRSLHACMTLENTQAFISWLKDQLADLDRLNRSEIDESVFRVRQGAALAISQILETMTNSKTEFMRLEGINSQARRNKQ